MKRPHIVENARGRLAAATGVFFFALVMLAPEPNLGIETPSAEAVKQFYLSNQQSFRASFLLTGLAYAFFLSFLATLRTELRKAEGGDGRLSGLAVGAGLLVAGFHVLGVTLWAAPALDLTADRDSAQVGAWALFGNASQDALVEVATFWRGVLLAAVAVVVLRYGALPRWLGWIAAALAIGSLIGSVAFLESPIEPLMTVLGFGSYIGFYFWVLLASIVLTVRLGGASAPEPISPQFDSAGVKATS